MNKFCSNCGEKINENAVICVKCGCAVKSLSQQVQNKVPGKGMGIASMVLGIISTFYSICALFIFVCLLASGEYLLIVEKIAFGFIFLMLPVILLVIGGSLGISSRSKTKNGVNLTGLILNFISLGLCLLSILVLTLV